MMRIFFWIVVVLVAKKEDQNKRSQAAIKDGKMKKILFQTMLFLVLPSVLAFAETLTVKEVIDCNTFKLNTNEEVRLIGVVCPKDAQKAKEAKEFVKSLRLKNKDTVQLEFDIEKRDQYGRLLAYVYVDSGSPFGAVASYPIGYYFVQRGFLRKDFLFINATIISSGYAQPANEPPNVKYANLFQKLYQEAKANKRGMWK